MNTVRNIVGFDTPSKREAVKEINSKKNPSVNKDMIVLETERRFKSIKHLMNTDEFKRMSIQAQQEIYTQFTYYSKLIEIL